MIYVHGTAAMYSHGPCRCVPCKQAASVAARHRYRMIAYGKWQPFTDAAPAREHVRALQAAGLGWERIAKLAGVAPPTVSSLLYGRAGRPPTRKIRTATAQTLLAFRPALDDLPPTAFTDAAGTRRRLQALTAAGWSVQRLAGRLGTDRAHAGRIIRGDNPRVTAATALQVRALCGELWDKLPPEGTHREKIAASRARNHARRMGWVPLAAWDAIDDPDAAPAAGWDRRNAARDWGVLAEEAAFLLAAGEESWRVAERLGVTPSTLSTTLARERKKAAREDADAAA